MRTTTYSRWHIIVIALCLQFTPINNCFANIKTAIANTGNGWNVAGNWSPAGMPQDGDTVIIPAGFTITVKGNIYGSTSPCLYIQAFGILDFDPSGKLELCGNAGLSVMAGASIQSHGSSSEIIRIGGVVKYNGQNDGTVMGPAFASSSTGASPEGFMEGVLAIHLFSFTARAEMNDVQLQWKATSDNPLDKFQVQRSADGQQWMTLAELAVTASDSEPVAYQYRDAISPTKTLFYRLALLNADGKTAYSPVASVQSGAGGMRTFPNPSVSATTVSWDGRTLQPVNIFVTDLRNAMVRKFSVHPAQTYQRIETTNLPGGQYFITLVCADGSTLSNKMLVLK